MIYRRKPVDVEVFAYKVHALPFWFIDATYTGEHHDDGNGTFASFRLKESKRILKLRDGDWVIRHGAYIWVCEREAFDNLYEVPVPDDEVAVLQVSASVAVMTTSAAGICFGIALGYWLLGAGFGWALIALLIFAIGMLCLSMLPTKENK